MTETRRSRGAVRGVAVLVVGFLAAGAFTFGSASAGKFLTRKKGDKRYVNVNETARTRLHYSGQDIDNTISGTYELMRTVGSFTKLKAHTDIMLHWNGTATANTGYCEFQPRIDGRKDTGSTSSSFEPASGGSAVVAGPDAVAPSALFSGLAAGAHTVSIWVQGTSGATCVLGVGNYGQTVIVEESP